MNIKAIFTTYSSKADIYGNRYHAVDAFNLDTEKTITALIDYPSNLRIKLTELRNCYTRPENRDFIIHEKDLPIREFNRLTKSWKYKTDTEIINEIYQD